MYYHTQENRGKELKKPIKCQRGNAWLGYAYYFWEDKNDAHYWGERSKKNNYLIYEMVLKQETEILDTVFNREHYNFWIKIIERTSKKIVKKLGIKPNLEQLNSALKDANVFVGIDGILFQDISKNENHYLVKGMQYKKRIQLALYNEEKIQNFRKL